MCDCAFLQPGLGCCHTVSVALYCRFGSQLPALAPSLPFLPPVGGRGEPNQGLCHPRVTVGPLRHLHSVPKSRTQHWVGDPRRDRHLSLWEKAVSTPRGWDWEWGGCSAAPQILWDGRGCAKERFPCRARRSWLPGLRTLLLAPLLTYVSVPFLIRLFPSVLTKFVYLNFREYPAAVPAGKTTPRDSAGCCRPPKKHGWDRDNAYPTPAVPWARRGGTEGSWPVFCKL